MKIGFFGGSFNPPSIAHLKLAKKAIKECKLDKVIFVPIGDFYDKEDLAPISDRIQMLKIACKNCNDIEVSDFEKDFKEKVYACDIFKIITKKYLKDDVFFLMGEDNYLKLNSWKNYKELLNYKYIIFERNKEVKIENNSNIYLIKCENTKEISSTLIREKIKNNDSLENIIDKDVEKFILKNELYNS
ncbi:MAG: nicotinate (nicotinamide) nucleotide adenylyltransferase [Clostridia bacterium]|nr:nicotinate (nicotinamide) nucleotide adenylyltransferase [Clostridia bacterium]